MASGNATSRIKQDRTPKLGNYGRKAQNDTAVRDLDKRDEVRNTLGINELNESRALNI